VTPQEKEKLCNRPIGVFDSGVGGLTVVKALLSAMPNENIVYLGDTARVPYGIKSKETVTRFSIECIGFLEKLNIKLALIACNTVSSFSIDILRQSFNVPVIGVIEPGVREACRVTKNKKIGVIGTRATVKSRAYVDGIMQSEPNAAVFQKACPLFVPLVEEQWFDEDITYRVAKKYLDELRTNKIDTIILGCTHYPMVKNVIKKVFNGKINIVDSSISVSDAVKTFLHESGLESTRPGKGKIQAFVTDDPDSFGSVSKVFLNKTIPVTKIDLK